MGGTHVPSLNFVSHRNGLRSWHYTVFYYCICYFHRNCHSFNSSPCRCNHFAVSRPCYLSGFYPNKASWQNPVSDLPAFQTFSRLLILIAHSLKRREYIKLYKLELKWGDHSQIQRDNNLTSYSQCVSRTV